ncbi:hypothetical protein C364_03107 [Cryptococcus neoformans Bt63]|nr:hypothetical protein C364_03107 [Cryptococcus neoformans var. grubii Bt63]
MTRRSCMCRPFCFCIFGLCLPRRSRARPQSTSVAASWIAAAEQGMSGLDYSTMINTSPSPTINLDRPSQCFLNYSHIFCESTCTYALLDPQHCAYAHLSGTRLISCSHHDDIVVIWLSGKAATSVTIFRVARVGRQSLNNATLLDMTTKTPRKRLLPPSPLALPASSLPSVRLEDEIPSLRSPIDSKRYPVPQQTPTKPPSSKSIPIPGARKRSKSYVYLSSPHSPDSVLPLTPSSTKQQQPTPSRLFTSTATEMSRLTLEMSPVKRHKLDANCDGTHQWGHKACCGRDIKQNDEGPGLSTGRSSSHASAEKSDVTPEKNALTPNRSGSSEHSSSKLRLNEQGQGHTVSHPGDCQRTTDTARI